MSKSRKKHNFDFIVCCRGDKPARKTYRSSERAKARNLLKDFEKTLDIDSDIDLINSRVDYSLKCASKWCWPSDGGPYFNGTLEKLSKEFDADVFGEPPYIMYNIKAADIWERYCRNRKFVNGQGSEKYKGLYRYDWFDCLFIRGKIPLNFHSKNSLIEWLQVHKKEIVETEYRFRLKK